MKAATVALVWAFGASTAVAQMIEPDGVLVLGAGKAGSWNTSITVTNVGTDPLDVRIGPNLGCGPFGGTCGTYASATIAPFATFVLPEIPESPYFSGPQAVYVRHGIAARVPVVSAVVADLGGSCERSMTLVGLGRAVAFSPGDLLFSGINRDSSQYSNLILAIRPPTGAPWFDETEVRVGVRDSAGVEVGAATYQVTSNGAVVVVDFLRELGILNLADGSVTLSEESTQNPSYSTFEGIITAVEPTRAFAIQGTRVLGH
jgi:hypothetical protein